MKTKILRIISLGALAAMLFTFSACSGSPGEKENVLYISVLYDENSPYKPSAGGSQNVVNNNVTPQGGSTGTQQTPATPNNNSSTPGASTDTPANGTPAATTAAQGNSDTPATPSRDQPAATPSDLPSTPADILAKYTELTDNMRKNLKSHDKKEYQEVQNLQLGALTSIANGIIPQFLKTADEAAVENKEGSGSIPPWCDAGCALTDANFIKAASCKDNGDGTATIVITLKDEKNSQPPENNVHTSEIGKMFSPLNKAKIEETLAGIPVVTVNSFDLTYRDCTVTAVYDKASGQLKNIEQIMNIDIVASAKALVTVNVTGTVVNHIEISNMVY